MLEASYPAERMVKMEKLTIEEVLEKKKNTGLVSLSSEELSILEKSGLIPYLKSSIN